MSELQWLLVILAVLYLWECLCWLPRGSAALISRFGSDWRLAHPGTLAGNQRGGFVLTQPLPPLGWILSAAQFPASLSPDGVLLYVATNVNPGWRPAQSGQYIPFDELREAAAKGKNIEAGGRLVLKAPYPRTARLWAAALAEIAKLPAAQRAEAIEKFQRGTFDDQAAEKLWQTFKKQARVLRLLDNVLLVYMFAVIPAVIWFIGLRLTWIELLAGLLALTFSIAVVVLFRAHRVLYPEEEDDRLTHAIILALSPATTPRAHDALSRPLLQTFHPLVPARLLPPPTAFQAFAAAMLRDMRHPALPAFAGDDAVKAAELQWRNGLRKTMEDYLKRNGLAPDKLCAPPKPADETCVAYCPRCLAQFTTTEAKCSDCGEMPVVGFAK